MSNRAQLAAAFPAMLLHEGQWDGWYRDVDCDGVLLDTRRVRTWCEFPEEGPWHYVQHTRLEWADGRRAGYDFGGALRDGRLHWETEAFAGYGWQTDGDVIMLRLDRRDVPDSYYVETICIAPDGQSRARTWQWFRDGHPWKRTLCDEARPAEPFDFGV